MNFVSVTDVNQYKYVFPSILSLDSFNRPFKYFICTSCIYTFNLLKDVYKHLKLKNGEVIILNIPSFFEYFNINSLSGNHEWISNTTLDRLVLPYVTDIEKVVYLDTDAFPVSDSIFDINFKVSDKGIGAVPNIPKIVDHVINFSDAEFLLSFAKTNFTTFNAGILFLDLELLRKNKLAEFVKELYSIGDNRIYINDELILNLYDPNYETYPLSYNVTPFIKHNFSEINIVHFSGKNYKPWLSPIVCENAKVIPYYHLWQYYYTSFFS